MVSCSTAISRLHRSTVVSLYGFPIPDWEPVHDRRQLPAENQRVVQQTAAELGRLDVLVNAAGTDVPKPVVDFGTEEWDRVLAVNLRAPFLLTKHSFPRLRAAGGGTVVNVSSVAGRRGWANASAY
jgi:NAD(P)-dependent dehydrogenase (short-subunit alcohol dehydrogenase family)